MPRFPQRSKFIPPAVTSPLDPEDATLDSATDSTPLLGPSTQQPSIQLPRSQRQRYPQLSRRGRPISLHTQQTDSEGVHQLQPQPHLQLQQSLVHDSEVEYHEQLIVQRDDEIQEIEQGIHVVNEIFRDLGSLVQEQGGMLDNIESNVTAIASHTESAGVELVRANTYQQNSRQIKCCILLLLAVMLAIVILFVV